MNNTDRMGNESRLASNLPPKTLKRQVAVRERGAAGSDAPCLGEDDQPALTLSRLTDDDRHRPGELQKYPDSLPVLSALKEFLDVERRRARNRMLGLLTAFLFALIVLTAGAFVAGAAYFKRMKTDVSGVLADMRGFRDDSLRLKSSADATLQDITRQTEALNAVTREQQQALATAKSEVAAQVQDYGQKLAELSETIRRLEMENSALKTNLHSLAGNETTAPDEPLARPDGDFSIPPAGAEATGYIVLKITPPDAGSTLEWRLPIPE